MSGPPAGPLVAPLREAARELEAAARWIGAQARSMIMILDTEGGLMRERRVALSRHTRCVLGCADCSISRGASSGSIA